MSTLYRPKMYPPEIRKVVSRLSPLAIEIANRWMLGWPETVKALLESKQYLNALIAQEEAEREALSQPGMNHLARHEIVQELGLSLSPPTAS